MRSEIPFHLKNYLATQEYDQYTAIDHASWRFIMRISCEFFKKHAHPIYLKGLEETGITVDRIPKITEMDQKLAKFGWRAVPITGFIPPAPFLEMLSLKIMPIACDMRKVENIDYTPSPDIVHEAAGHAPIIADPAYSSYLKKFGEIARFVIFAKEDCTVYEAVLNLSEIKEDPNSTEEQIQQAQKMLDKAAAGVYYVSEAQQLTRLGWWSTEYGLIEKDGKYLIYGAGLLSSVGESYYCIDSKVPKVPLTIKCIETDYDITKPQPQLFVTDDFKKLENVIDELASMMSYKRGGKYGLEKAKQAETVVTVQFENGLQVSGILDRFDLDSNENLEFLKFKGPCQISKDFKQIPGHSAKYHKDGFSSPLGNCDGLDSAVEWKPNQNIHLKFKSGFELQGAFKKSWANDGKPQILTFADCKITKGNETLFDPSWGDFDLVVGSKAVSVFGGAADRSEFVKDNPGHLFKPRAQKRNQTAENKILIPLYEKVRSVREGKGDLAEVISIANDFESKHSNEWLLGLELVEILAPHKSQNAVREKILARLDQIKKKSDKLKMLVDRGLELIH